MGKSTTARIFAEEGCAVWDADAAVHRLYASGGRAVEPIAAIYPSAIEAGAVSRARLKEIIGADPSALPRIASVVHPLVAEDRAAFIAANEAAIVVLDIPLLFETGGDARVDYTVVVSAPADVQRRRVLERGTMSVAQFDAILAKQMPDADKRRRADFVIETDTLEHAREQVRAVLEKLNHA